MDTLLQGRKNERNTLDSSLETKSEKDKKKVKKTTKTATVSWFCFFVKGQSCTSSLLGHLQRWKRLWHSRDQAGYTTGYIESL